MNGLSWYQSIQRNPIEEQTLEAKLDVAVEVERIMIQNGLSRAQLAKTMGTSAPYISKILQGDANLSIESLVKIATALNTQLDICFRAKNQTARWFKIIDRNNGLQSKNEANFFGTDRHKIKQPALGVSGHVEAA